MRQGLLVLLLIVTSLPVLARDMSGQQEQCYKRIRDEAKFIVSRIELIQRQYENQVKHSGLGKFKSGAYSTSKLLDNTIRKYHRKLVQQLKNYPIRYASQHRLGQHPKSTRCLAAYLQYESVGTIHEFELSWQQTLRQVRKNARYFKQLDDMQ